ncbi:MAG: hypothetical protein E6X12_03620 [Actinomyces sp.]|nr:hypothetical protein [Actinomyces sp.]
MRTWLIRRIMIRGALTRLVDALLVRHAPRRRQPASSVALAQSGDPMEIKRIHIATARYLLGPRSAQ